MGVQRSAGAFFFVWTIYALGVIGIFGFILSVRALRGVRQSPRAGSAVAQ